MTMLSVKCSILFLIAVSGFWQLTLAEEPNNKLNVLILYESLCPDSIRFMRDQLGPNYDSLKDAIDVTLVPFGKSQSTNNGARFFCQHGPDECEGNRMQSCVLQQTADQETQVKFAVCQMSRYRSSIQNCAQSVGLSTDVDDCVNSQVGTLLQLDAEQITQSYNPSFVPTIIYDGQFNQQLQDSSLSNFKGVVCRLLQKRGSSAFNSVC